MVHKRAACKKARAHARKASRRDVRHAVTCLVNEARRRHGIGRLHYDGQLKRAAQRHTRRMLSGHCFSHQCPGEADLSARVAHSGYTRRAHAWALGEDLGVKHSPLRMVRAWMQSSPHRNVLLGRRYRDAGVGVGWGTPSGGGRGESTFTLDAGWRQR